jgi:hypothetical protein
MNTYHVVLSRSFLVTINANSADSASKLAEFFLGFQDESSVLDRNENDFSIQSIEMLENNVVDVKLENQ